jgi:putative hydrolase of the HAD superfamily
MLPDRRAVVFDMDDTIYPYRRFVASGFAAVAAHVERTCRIDRRKVLRSLLRASRGTMRGREIQACQQECGISAALLPALISVMRHHQPSLSLPRTVATVLRELRRNGWRLGVLTNGPRDIQARKVAALGIARYVDTVVYATEHGQRLGKPDPEPFNVVLARLNVPAASAVVVGDDEVCDVIGGASAGLSTVRCTVWRRDGFGTAADASLVRFSQLPVVVEQLLSEVTSRHAA